MKSVRIPRGEARSCILNKFRDSTIQQYSPGGRRPCPVLVLGEGVRTAALAVAEFGGEPYLKVSDLVAAVDGVRAASVDSSYAYAVEWRPDLGQLCLWRDAQHPIS